MVFFIRATCVAILILPVLCVAEEDGDTTVKDVDEIVVVGRWVTTGSSRIEVQRELLVDTATVLRDIPGADVNANGPITGIAQYRGMYGDRVSVSVDGLGITSGGPNAMDTPLSYVSPMITKDLEVQRGIAQVSSAAESVGGHIATTVARGDFGTEDAGLSGFVGARYSNNGGISTTAGRLTLANDRHRFSIVGEYDDGDHIATPEGEMRPSQLNRERYDVSYAYKSDKSNLLFFAGRLDTTDTGTPALPMDIRLIETDVFGLQFGTVVGPEIALQGQFGFNDVDHLMDNFSLRQAPMPMMYRQNFATGNGFHFKLSGLLDRDTYALRVGIDGVSAEHDSTITNPNNSMFSVSNFSNVDRDLSGIFAEWSRSGRASEVELGMRYNQVQARAGTVGASGMMGMMATNVAGLAASFNGANREPKWSSVDAVAKYRHALSDSVEWTLELGSRSRAPSYQELFLWLPLQATGGLADGRTYIGNLDLDTERSNEIVIGVTASSKRFGLAPQVFFKKVDDYIQGVPSTNSLANMVSTMMTGSAPLQFDNVDAEIWGVDIAWRVTLSDRWLLDGIASYARGKRTDVDDNLYRLAPLNGSFGLTYSRDDWSLKSEIVAYARQNDVSSFNSEAVTGAYWLSNLAYSWSPRPSLRVEARIDNLLDESYQDHLAGINRASGSDIPQGVRLFGAERTLSAGLIYSF